MDKIHLFMDNRLKSSYVDYMDYQTFKLCVRRAGMEIKDFAGMVGLNHRSISNYSKRGEIPMHLAIMAVMMVELVKQDVDLKAVFAKSELTGRHRKKTEGGFKGKRGA